MQVELWFDGLCEPNPGGVACGGWAGELTGYRYFGRGAGMTNNVAEYEAALAVLRLLYKTGYRDAVVLRGDSQLVVNQFTGKFGCHAELLAPRLAKLHIARTYFSSLELAWVPREENAEADEQSRLAYVEITGRQPPERVRKPKHEPVRELSPIFGADLDTEFPPVNTDTPAIRWACGVDDGALHYSVVT